MKSFLKLLVFGFIAFSASTLPSSDSLAQTRDLGANRLILDDGMAMPGILTITYAGPGNSNFIIPPGGATTVQPGTMAGQTLRWDGALWIPSNALTNDGTNIAVMGDLSVLGMINGDGSGITNINASNIATGTLNDARLSSNVALLDAANSFTDANTFTTVNGTTFNGGTFNGDFVGNGSGVTALNASNVSTGSLDLARISTTGAMTDQALMYNGTNLVYAFPSASSLVLPFSQTASSASTLFSLTNTGTGRAGYFEISNALSDAATVRANNNGSGIAVYGYTNGTGNAGRFQIDNSSNNLSAVWATTTGTGRAGFFEVDNALSDATVIRGNTNGTGFAIYGYTEGTGTAARFEIDNSSNSSHALWSSTSGTGRAARFQINNATSNSAAVSIETNGTGPALLLLSGGLVGTYQTVNAGGTIPTGSVTVHIVSNGTGTATSVSQPSGGINGQIMVVCTNDSDGATVTGVGSIPPSGCITMVRTNGVWRATQ